MDEHLFWTILDRVDQTALEEQRELDAARAVLLDLVQRKADAIIEFYTRLAAALRALDTRKHFDAGPPDMTEDGFLGFRCYLVGRGRRYYELVRGDSRQTPKNYASFETLLVITVAAWKTVTGRDDFPNKKASLSFETRSNTEAWFVPDELYSIRFIDTRGSVEAMLAADRSQSATVGCELSAFVACLNKVNFKSKHRVLQIDLNPKLALGAVKLPPTLGIEVKLEELGELVRLEVGFDAEKFSVMDQDERRNCLVDGASAALLFLHQGDDENASRIAEARALIRAAV